MALRSYFDYVCDRIPDRSISGPALLLAVAFTICTVGSLSAQNHSFDPVGTWNGSIDVPGQPLNISVVISRGNDASEYSGVYSIPQQGISRWSVDEISITGSEISFSLGGGIPGNPSFKLHTGIDEHHLEGTFRQSGATLSASFVREAASTSTAQSEALEKIISLMERAVNEGNVPGMALGIVRDGKVLLSRGFGTRDVDHNRPVTEQTLFPIGSTTKAFTSVLIGQLVSEGRLQWDDRVVDYLPDFRLKDEYATEHMTITDLLTHVSGLPRHDLMWYGSDFTRQELFNRLRYLEPTAELRQEWQYQNLMFMTAGILAERVTDSTWEELVQHRILDPLGMKRTTLSIESLQKRDDYSLPYSRSNGTTTKIDFRNIDAIGPAGAINSSVADMNRWMLMNLDGGELDGQRVIAESALDNIQAPHVVIAPVGTQEGMLFNLYGMGWMLSSYRGHKLLYHGGGIDGFVTQVTLLPEDGIGIVILSNRPTGLPEPLALDIADLLLGNDSYDQLSTALTLSSKVEDAVKDVTKQKDVVRVTGTHPSHRLEEYVGDYEHPAYGTITVGKAGERLTAMFHDEPDTLVHYHYDVFASADDEGNPVASYLVNFQTGSDGSIQSLSIPLEPTVEAIRFDRKPSGELVDPSFLKRLAGTYTLKEQKLEVSLQNNQLVVTIPGQPPYQLDPERMVAEKFAQFHINGLEAFVVRFVANGTKGEFNQILFIQPNGTFEANR